jgi:pimeloyl-ACP methyl ester carboxylesterase
LVLLDPVFQRGLQGKQRRIWQLRWLVRAVRALIAAANVVGIRRRHIPNRDIRKLDEETREALRGADSFDEIAKRYSALGPILASLPTANYLGQVLATVGPLPPLEQIEVPVAVLLSGSTTLANNEINRQEAARFPNRAVLTLAANHWPLTEAPDETRQAIEDWIDRTFGGDQAV